jgi:hypothetical protein
MATYLLSLYLSLPIASAQSQQAPGRWQESLQYVSIPSQKLVKPHRRLTFSLLSFLFSKVLLLLCIDILHCRLVIRQVFESRAFDGQALCWISLGAILAWPKGIVQSGLLGEIAFEIPPHQPQKSSGSTAAAQGASHDKVKEVPRREEMHF